MTVYIINPDKDSLTSRTGSQATCSFIALTTRISKPTNCEFFSGLLDHLRPGDVVVVWKLDRLSRSLMELLRIIDKVETKGAGFQSLTEAIDTTTPAGRMMMQMVGSFAEFEREMIRQRTRAGLNRARREGRVGGRRPKLSPRQRREVIEMVSSGRKTAADAARVFGVHPATVGRLLKSQNSE